jgi:hypothetical protein
MLRSLKSHPINYHSLEILQVLPKLFKRASLGQALAEYLDSRIISASFHINGQEKVYIVDGDRFKPIAERDYNIRTLEDIPLEMN